uniref:Amidase domain-containing protein n=1 Tax=Rhabditophanes sp. KR3021 TaxID=114890 RepID=A0AC35THM3_9BILA
MAKLSFHLLALLALLCVSQSLIGIVFAEEHENKENAPSEEVQAEPLAAGSGSQIEPSVPQPEISEEDSRNVQKNIVGSEGSFCAAVSEKNKSGFQMMTYAVYFYVAICSLFVILKIISFADVKSQRKFDKIMLRKLGIIEASGFTFGAPVPNPEARKNLPVSTKEEHIFVSNLKTAGAIPLSFTNVPEMCFWIESSNMLYGTTSNPYDTRRTSGGSSGGEGARIGADASLFGIGSDIAGSIRIPATFCGVFGYKCSPFVYSGKHHIPDMEDGNPVGYMASEGPLCRYGKDLKLISALGMKDDVKLRLKIDEPVDLKTLNFFTSKTSVTCKLNQPIKKFFKA